MGKKKSRISDKGRNKCVKKTLTKGLTSSTPEAKNKYGDIILRWLTFELRLLQRLVYRNKNQHRSSAFMSAVCGSVRSLKRFTSFFKQKRSTDELAILHLDEEFNRKFYISLKDVLTTSAEISRMHAHYAHVPLITVLLSIYG
ncbi:uncharacterized protein BXIN_2123 [Babesia sp. Xinjiang]|uniref:uncharacterized protein n=1 Tax=Babesia sp. Xinjiang TaxID=462227 RepID=UPI000A2555CF|nr:uncharacterized protein BXIN_2123 [Babesia sp. Xinjiang]ORM40562.1 hypothetical protein BXIN_2123 [Babesia sp. Xinjiang]